jgi:uncharacterized membrane-anchored protein YhcB (DUF1043 family)
MDAIYSIVNQLLTKYRIILLLNSIDVYQPQQSQYRKINMNEWNELLPFFFTLLAGGLLGFLIYHITLGKSKTSKQQEELDKNKIELEKYKAQVNDHFNNSAELMGQVANSYQALYNHMADQSQSLLGESATTQFPLLKKSDDTDEEIEIADTEAKPEKVEATATEVKSEETEITDTEVKQEEAVIIDTEVKQEEAVIIDTEVKTEEVDTTDTEVKPKEAEITVTEAKSEEVETTELEENSKKEATK